jgi:hypothetical protein
MKFKSFKQHINEDVAEPGSVPGMGDVTFPNAQTGENGSGDNFGNLLDDKIQKIMKANPEYKKEELEKLSKEELEKLFNSLEINEKLSMKPDTNKGFKLWRGYNTTGHNIGLFDINKDNPNETIKNLIDILHEINDVLELKTDKSFEDLFMEDISKKITFVQQNEKQIKDLSKELVNTKENFIKDINKIKKETKDLLLKLKK